MLKSEKVSEIFQNCLLKDCEIKRKIKFKYIKVRGLKKEFLFHPKRLKDLTLDIHILINDLPDDFKDGQSFLKLCKNKRGQSWTESYEICEQLMLLGIAIKEVKYCCLRTMWGVFPDEMPYIQIKFSKSKNKLHNK